MKRILVTRTDRLGDVLLATPVLRRIRDHFPEARIFFLVQKQWMPILQFGEEVELVEYRPEETPEVLATRISALQCDAAIVLRDEATVSRAVKLAGIQFRVGPYSTLRSFFNFNRGRLQRRSRCQMHEAEYNLALLTRVGLPRVTPAKTANELPRSWVQYSPKADTTVQSWLASQGLMAGAYLCFHPGSSGSARYLSKDTMIEFLRKMTKGKTPVVLTGGPQELSLLNELKMSLSESEGTGRLIIFGQEQARSLDELAALYRHSKGVVAHGTGPLHLAAAVGAPVYAIFPPLFVLSEKRWGPLTSKRVVWTPHVPCPEKFQCRGVKCRYYDCMNLFESDVAIIKMEQLTRNT